MHINKLLTIVLPTRNRPDLLRRSLMFYAYYGLSYPIAVADSSDPAYLDEMYSLMKEFPQVDLTITHFDPEYNSWLKIIEVMEQQSCPFIALSGDDDFLLDKAITASISFLIDNPDFSVVDGREVRIARSGALLESFWGYSAILHQQNAVIADDPIARLVQYFQSYWPTFYGVHRKDSVIEAFRSGYEMETENLVSELMQGAVTVLNGKYKSLPIPYIVRQVYHNQSTAFDSWEKIVHSDEFDSQLKYFRQRVQNKLPDDKRVPGACDLAFSRFLEGIFPDFDFLASALPVENGEPAHLIAKQIELHNNSARESAQVRTPLQFRDDAMCQETPELIAVAYSMYKHPEGVTTEEIRSLLPPELSQNSPSLLRNLVSRFSQGGFGKDLKPQFNQNSSLLLRYLISRLCLDGFGKDLRDLLRYVEQSGHCATYLNTEFLTSKTHYTLPELSFCVATANLAQFYGKIQSSIALIDFFDQPGSVKYMILDEHVKQMDASSGLEQAVLKIIENRETGVAALKKMLNKPIEVNSSGVETAHQLAVYGAFATEIDFLSGAPELYAEILPVLDASNTFRHSLLADFARIAFSDQKSYLIAQHDWRALVETAEFTQPESIYWASEYAGVLRLTDQQEFAVDILEAARKSVENNREQPGMGRAIAHLSYQTGLLYEAEDRETAPETLQLAADQLTEVYGIDNWMTQDALKRL